MVFKNNIPQPNDNLSVSQGDLLGNNQQLDTSFGVNHYTFSDLTASNGKHKFVTLVPQAAPATLATELALYSATPPGEAVCLFLTRNNNLLFDVQLTSTKIQQPIGATNGYTFLPGGPVGGGIILQWGTVTAGAVGQFPVLFNTPFANNCFNVSITPICKIGGTTQEHVFSVVSGSVTAAGFDYNTNATTTYPEFYWIAYGN